MSRNKHAYEQAYCRAPEVAACLEPICVLRVFWRDFRLVFGRLSCSWVPLLRDCVAR